MAAQLGIAGKGMGRIDALLAILAGAMLAYTAFPHSQPMSEAAVLNAVGACELGGGIAVPQGMLTRPSDEVYAVHCLQRADARPHLTGDT